MRRGSEVARLARRGGVRPAELQHQLLSSNACTSSLCTCATDTACCLPPGKDVFLRLHGGGSFEKREQLLLWQLQVVAAVAASSGRCCGSFKWSPRASGGRRRSCRALERTRRSTFNLCSCALSSTVVFDLRAPGAGSNLEECNCSMRYFAIVGAPLQRLLPSPSSPLPLP